MSLKSKIFLLIPKIFLLIPLCFFIHIWLTMAFNFDVTPDWLFYDTDPHPEDPPVKGLLPDVLYVFIMFVFSPLSFIIGSIYTAYKKLWWWFAIYMLLFGFPANIFLYLSFQDDVVAPIILAIIGIPSSFVIGLIYTAYKKLWWWFAASQVIGFGFWIYLHLS